MKDTILLQIALLLGFIVHGWAQEQPPAPSNSNASSPPSTLGMESINELLRRTMDDPRTAERRRLMLKANVKQTYADFVQVGRLKPPKSDEFLELLTDREMIDLQDSTSFLAGDPDARSEESVEKLAALAFAAVDQALQALLSESDYRQFREYEKTVSERVALAEIRQELAMNSEPLSNDQITFLQQVLSDERQRTPPVAYDPRGPGTYREKAHLAARGENGAQFLKAQSTMDQRVLVRAKEVLSADQYEVLAKFYQQYADVEKTAIELARKIIAQQSAAAPTP